MSVNNYPVTDPDSPVEVWFNDDMLSVKLCDGRIVSTPLDWYPRLAAASSAQRQNFELMSDGIHWVDLDEDLSVRGMLMGWKSKTPAQPFESQSKSD